MEGINAVPKKRRHSVIDGAKTGKKR